MPPPPPPLAAADTGGCLPLKLFTVPSTQVAGLPSLKQRLAELEQAAAAEDLWEQRGRAQAVLQQLNQLREEVGQLDRFSGQLDDLAVAVELLEMEVGAGRFCSVTLHADMAGWIACDLRAAEMEVGAVHGWLGGCHVVVGTILQG